MEKQLEKDLELKPVRCPTCGKKLGEGLTGSLLAFCRHCKETSLITSRPEVALAKLYRHIAPYPSAPAALCAPAARISLGGFLYFREGEELADTIGYEALHIDRTPTGPTESLVQAGSDANVVAA